MHGLQCLISACSLSYWRTSQGNVPHVCDCASLMGYGEETGLSALMHPPCCWRQHDGLESPMLLHCSLQKARSDAWIAVPHAWGGLRCS